MSTVTKKRFDDLLKSGNIPEDALQALIDECDPIIHVDCTAPVVYPDWVRKVLYPELELVGPSNFNITELESYLHPKQGDGYATGNELFTNLIAKKMLEGCLGLADFLAIQARGIGFFRRHYSGKAVFGWRSVVQYRSGDLGVPYLIEYGGRVILHWCWLGYRWHSNYPALRFRSFRK